MIYSDGDYAIGYWKDGEKLHGYAKRSIKGVVQEGLWENAGWRSGQPKRKKDIKKYHPYTDKISKKLDWTKYIKFSKTQPKH